MTHEQAAQRFARAEKIVDNAVTEDDLKQALNMIVLNQMFAKAPIPNETASEQEAEKRDARFLSKVGEQLVRLMDEAIEVLQARCQELPNSPIQAWQADLERLQRLHGEHHDQLRYPPYQPAVKSMTFWYQKIRQMEKFARRPQSRAGRRGTSAVYLPLGQILASGQRSVAGRPGLRRYGPDPPTGPDGLSA